MIWEKVQSFARKVSKVEDDAAEAERPLVEARQKFYKRHWWAYPVVLIIAILRFIGRQVPAPESPDQSSWLIERSLATRIVSLGEGKTDAIYLHVDKPDSTYYVTLIPSVEGGPDISWIKTWDSIYKRPGSDTIFVFKDVNVNYEPVGREVNSWIILAPQSDTSNVDTTK